MTWIAQCDAPDLEHLSTPVISTYLLNLIFLDRGGSNNLQVRTYVHAFILCTDKAIRAYCLGRGFFSQYVASRNRTTLLFQGLAEFETCISTVKRCLSLADRMATHSDNPDIDRTTRRLLVSYQARIRPIRDAIEHMDDDIARGASLPGGPLFLFACPDGSGLTIATNTLSFITLARTIERLHDIALSLASRERGPSSLDK